MKTTAFLSITVFMAIISLAGCKENAPVAKPAPAKAALAGMPQGTETKGPKVEEEVFLYDKTGKRDPFVSLIAKAQEAPKKGQTPLESYDVSAIKVLGIVWNNKGYHASIVLPDGKAYTINEGMTIGLHQGKIQKINNNSVVIKELIKDYRGEIKPKETILKLREEEEE